MRTTGGELVDDVGVNQPDARWRTCTRYINDRSLACRRAIKTMAAVDIFQGPEFYVESDWLIFDFSSTSRWFLKNSGSSVH